MPSQTLSDKQISLTDPVLTGKATRAVERASRATFNSGLKSLAFPSGPRYAFYKLVMLIHTRDKVIYFHAFEYIGAVVEA